MHGFRGDIATHCPRPSGGEEAGGRAGWGDEVFGSLRKTGEGETPPRQPHPHGDSHHGPRHEDMREKNHMMPVGPQAYRMKICR